MKFGFLHQEIRFPAFNSLFMGGKLVTHTFSRFSPNFHLYFAFHFCNDLLTFSRNFSPARVEKRKFSKLLWIVQLWIHSMERFPQFHVHLQSSLMAEFQFFFSFAFLSSEISFFLGKVNNVRFGRLEKAYTLWQNTLRSGKHIYSLRKFLQDWFESEASVCLRTRVENKTRKHTNKRSIFSFRSTSQSVGGLLNVCKKLFTINDNVQHCTFTCTVRKIYFGQKRKLWGA